MLKIFDREHIFIVLKTLGIQLIIFCAIIFIMYGSQSLYAMLDPVKFPSIYELPENAANLPENEKGIILLNSISNRITYELNSPLGWTANDILLNPYILDNRAYRQYGTYIATKTLVDFFSVNMSKLGSNDRENDNTYNARMNSFALSPKRWGYLFIPSAESSYKNGLNLLSKYKKELESGTAIYNCRPDDVYNAFGLLVGETIIGYSLGLLQNSQELSFSKLDNRIYEAQGVMLVVRDFVNALYTLYPDVCGKNNAENMAVAMRYLDEIANYNPLYITSSLNSGELMMSYILFVKNRLEDIRDSIRI